MSLISIRLFPSIFSNDFKLASVTVQTSLFIVMELIIFFFLLGNMNYNPHETYFYCFVKNLFPDTPDSIYLPLRLVM